MNWEEYSKIIESTPYAEGIKFETAFMFPFNYLVPMKAISIGACSDKVVRLPGRTRPPYGRMPGVVISFSKELFSGNENVTDIILHSDISSIPGEAFAGCTNLQRITIPKSVKYIAAGTFAGCTSLTDVYYEGNASEWAEINIVHHEKQIEFGDLVPGTPVQKVESERLVHVPGNDALLLCNIHCRCELGAQPPMQFGITLGGRNVTSYFQYEDEERLIF